MLNLLIAFGAFLELSDNFGIELFVDSVFLSIEKVAANNEK